jgi:long-chain acyl-CoA synthetase
VRYFISGGDALPDKIKLYFALIYRRMIANGYGLTESSPVVALDVDDAISAPNTVGAPLVGTECQLRSTDDTVITHGIGTLFIKSDAIMLGYYKAPELTASVLQDGWLNTGDLAYFDADKKLVIVGRSKDLIICKGMNVYPQEIENILLTHPAIFQAAVVGIKGEDDASQTVVAFVASRSLNTSLEAELIDLCHEKLAAYKAPRRIILLNELPLTATGKVDKKLLIATHLI